MSKASEVTYVSLFFKLKVFVQIFIDNKLLRNMIALGNQSVNAIVEACKQANISIERQDLQLIQYWPALFECLNLQFLFDEFFKFDETHSIFDLLTKALELDLNKELLINLYDQLFVECLTHVKNISAVNADFLIEQIQIKRESLQNHPLKDLIAPLLNHFEKYFVENRSKAMHDLILYLAWDRMCICIAQIFEHNSSSTSIREGLNVLKECILESFQHITIQNRTSPGFFRLVEALHADEMREENLQKHSDEAWLILCQGTRALKQRETLADIFYVDGAIINKQQYNHLDQIESLKLITLESVENVESGVFLAKYLMEKKQSFISEWFFSFRPIEVISLAAVEAHYHVEKVVCSDFF